MFQSRAFAVVLLAWSWLQAEPALAQDTEGAHRFMAQALPRAEATFGGEDFVSYEGAKCRSIIRFTSRELVVDWTEVTDTGWNSALLLTGRFAIAPGGISQQKIDLKSTDLAMRLSTAARTLQGRCDPTKSAGF
jgi:hypothetical protein